MLRAARLCRYMHRFPVLFQALQRADPGSNSVHFNTLVATVRGDHALTKVSLEADMDAAMYNDVTEADPEYVAASARACCGGGGLTVAVRVAVTAWRLVKCCSTR